MFTSPSTRVQSFPHSFNNVQLYSSPNSPTPHLPHLLRILGLSTLTLYKCILARRRIMIFTLPPVEVACILSWIAADLCRDHHLSKGGKGWRGGALASGLFEGVHSLGLNAILILFRRIFRRTPYAHGQDSPVSRRKPSRIGDGNPQRPYTT